MTKNIIMLDFNIAKDVIQCPICLVRFKDPVKTPCDHVFCRLCLGEATTCQLCNTSIKPEDVKPNIIVSSILNAIQSSATCTACQISNNEDLQRCEHCYDMLCQACRKKHTDEEIRSSKQTFETIQNRFMQFRANLLQHGEIFHNQTLITNDLNACTNDIELTLSELTKRIYDTVLTGDVQALQTDAQKIEEKATIMGVELEKLLSESVDKDVISEKIYTEKQKNVLNKFSEFKTYWQNCVGMYGESPLVISQNPRFIELIYQLQSMDLLVLNNN